MSGAFRVPALRAAVARPGGDLSGPQRASGTKLTAGEPLPRQALEQAGDDAPCDGCLVPQGPRQNLGWSQGRVPGNRGPLPPATSTTRSGAAARCVVQRLRCVVQGFRRDRTDDAGWHVVHRSKVEAHDHPRAVHPGDRPYCVLCLVMVRLERLGVPRGTVLDADRVVTAAPQAPRCQRTRSVLPRPSGAGPARPAWGPPETPRRRRRARRLQPPPVVRAAPARALNDRAVAMAHLHARPGASTGADPGAGSDGPGLVPVDAAAASRQKGVDAVLRAFGAADPGECGSQVLSRWNGAEVRRRSPAVMSPPCPTAGDGSTDATGPRED